MACSCKRLLLLILLSVAIPSFGGARPWLVRIPSSKSHVLYKASGIKIIHRYRHIAWLKVETTDDGSRWINEAVARGELVAEDDPIVQLAALPNDPLIATQLFIQPANPAADIHLADAWNLQTSATAPVIAVVDSGVDTSHPDLIDNLWRNEVELNGTDGVDDDQNGFVDDIYGWNAIEANGDVTDTLDPIYHGTHVTGVAGATGNNGIGITGVCWNCRIMQVRCFGPDPSRLSDLLDGLEYIFDFPEVRAINASWGFTSYNQALSDAIDVAAQKQMIIIAAAGNSEKDIDADPFYPASLDRANIITVTGIQTDGQLWASGTSGYGSSFGTKVSVTAPAAPTYSAFPGNSYQNDSGTSFAAPHVLAAVALLLQRNPEMTPAEVKQRVIETSRRTPELSTKPLGGGLLDVRALIAVPSSAAMWWGLE